MSLSSHIGNNGFNRSPDLQAPGESHHLLTIITLKATIHP